MRICCMCGFEGERHGVKWCRVCEHHFCKSCRRNWFGRGLAFVGEYLLNNPPLYCQKEGHNDRNTRATGPS